MTVGRAISELQKCALAISGMRAAPPTPTESASVYPFAVSYERAGRLALRSSGFGDNIVTIYTEFHVSRQLLPRAIEQAMGMRDEFIRSIIADPTLNGTVSTVQDVRWTFGRLEWGGVETIGYRFEVDVKIPTVV